MNLLKKSIALLLLCIASAGLQNSYSQLDSDSILVFYRNFIQNNSFEESEKYYNKISGDFIQTRPKLVIELSNLYISNAISKNKIGAIPGALARIGQAYFTLGDIEKSIDYSTKSIEMLDYFGKADETGFMLIDLGNVQLLDRKLDEAKNLYRKAIGIFQKKKDFKGIAVACNNLGISFNREKNYDSALVYFGKALKIREKFNEPYYILQSYIYIAEIYNFQKDTEKAVATFHKADSIASVANPKKDEGYSVMINLFDAKANFYLQKKEYKNAIKYYVQAAEFARTSFGDKLAEAEEYSSAAKAAMLDQNYRKAIELALLAKKLGEESGSNLIQIIAYDVLHKSYAELGNYTEAYHAFNNYTNLHRLIESKSINEKLNSLESKFQIREKEQLLALKDAELESLKKEEKNQILLNWIITGFSAVAIIILTLVLWLFWLSKKSNKELVGKNLIIEQKSNEILQANKTKDIMISVIAHDLRNPINSIISFADLIESETKIKANSETPKYARIVQNSGRQTSILLENLLQWYQSQSGKLSYRPAEFLLHESLQNCIEFLKGMIESKGVEFRFNVIEVKLFADEQMFQTILRNLITNAIKFIPANGLIRISTQVVGNNLELIIEDNGPGFNTLNADAAQPNQYESMKGSGLGLILCRDFLDRIGGYMETGKSEFGGALVRIILPSSSVIEVSNNQTDMVNFSNENIDVNLSLDEILMIQNILAKNHLPKIYEATKWKILIEELKQLNSSSKIQDWTNRLEKAVFISNENDMKELLNQVTVKI